VHDRLLGARHTEHVPGGGKAAAVRSPRAYVQAAGGLGHGGADRSVVVRVCTLNGLCRSSAFAHLARELATPTAEEFEKCFGEAG
jgi:hypothetical protein